MNQTKETNKTIKYNQVDAKLIRVESVKMGKDQVPLIRYGKDGSTLNIQLPWIKLSQYGLPPGEKLGNGADNEYYTTEEARESIRLPLDESIPEIKELIHILQEMDKHIKHSEQIKTESAIEEDNYEKYKPIYRKPGKSKKTKKDEVQRVKHNYIKIKIDTDYKSKAIKSEFVVVDRETKEVSKFECSSIKDLESLLVYNSEIQAIVQVVKVWEQASGDWGVTLKLKKARVMKPESRGQISDADFVDDEDGMNANEVLSSKPEASAKASVDVPTDSDSDNDDKPSKPSVKSPPVSSKGKPTKPVESDSDDSDSDSDKKPPAKPAPQTKTTVKPTRQPVQSDSDSDDSDSVSDSEKKPPAKPAPPAKKGGKGK